jgi:hypothetical protein
MQKGKKFIQDGQKITKRGSWVVQQRQDRNFFHGVIERKDI